MRCSLNRGYYLDNSPTQRPTKLLKTCSNRGLSSIEGIL